MSPPDLRTCCSSWFYDPLYACLHVCTKPPGHEAPHAYAQITARDHILKAPPFRIVGPEEDA